MSSELERAVESATSVPAAVTDAARGALRHHVAGALAEITADVVEGTAGTRRRRLAWTAGGVDIHADVEPGTGGATTLRCRVVGAVLVAASVDVPATTQECAVAGNAFEADDVPAGPVRLLVEVADGSASRAVHTDWVTV